MSRGHDAIQVVCDKLTKRVHFLCAHSTDTAEDMCDTAIGMPPFFAKYIATRCTRSTL